ncbi:hypothetical protein IJ182_01570, partial [bacterium]|nr:hypothetical protein [bacterium]
TEEHIATSLKEIPQVKDGEINHPQESDDCTALITFIGSIGGIIFLYFISSFKVVPFIWSLNLILSAGLAFYTIYLLKKKNNRAIFYVKVFTLLTGFYLIYYTLIYGLLKGMIVFIVLSLLVFKNVPLVISKDIEKIFPKNERKSTITDKIIVTVITVLIVVAICLSACNTSNNMQVTTETNKLYYPEKDTITEKDIVNPEELFKEKPNYPDMFVITNYKANIMLDIFPDVNNYDINSLFDWHGKVAKGLVKFFNSVYPKTNANEKEKIAHILNGYLSDDIFWRTRPDLEYNMIKYKVVEETKNLLDTDSTFISEITAWQTLNKCLDKYIDNSVYIAWYNGNGQGPEIKDDKIIILKNRLMDLQRINAIYQHQVYQHQVYEQQKLKSSSLDITKNKFEKVLKKQTKDIIAKSKEMVNDNYYNYNYTKADDRKTINTIKQAENNVLNALNDWLNVRDSLQNAFNDDKDKHNFIKSSTELLYGISESIPCPTSG